eukprot:scaffold586586_cov114-Attheya_sp.AAC.4
MQSISVDVEAQGTTLLHQLGDVLAKTGKKVYFFKNSNSFQRDNVIDFFDELEKANEEDVVVF